MSTKRNSRNSSSNDKSVHRLRNLTVCSPSSYTPSSSTWRRCFLIDCIINHQDGSTADSDTTAAYDSTMLMKNKSKILWETNFSSTKQFNSSTQAKLLLLHSNEGAAVASFLSTRLTFSFLFPPPSFPSPFASGHKNTTQKRNSRMTGHPWLVPVTEELHRHRLSLLLMVLLLLLPCNQLVLTNIIRHAKAEERSSNGSSSGRQCSRQSKEHVEWPVS